MNRSEDTPPWNQSNTTPHGTAATPPLPCGSSCSSTSIGPRPPPTVDDDLSAAPYIIPPSMGPFSPPFLHVPDLHAPPPPAPPAPSPAKPTKRKKPFVGGSMETQREWERRTLCCFALQGTCRYGAGCRFLHEDDGTRQCQFAGNCNAGHADRCPPIHTVPAPIATQPSPQTPHAPAAIIPDTKPNALAQDTTHANQ